MNSRLIGAVVSIAILAVIVAVLFLGGRTSAAPQGPTDLVRAGIYEVHDTFICDDGDPSAQVREWHFAGDDRSRRSQFTVDWYRNMNGRKVSRIRYNPSAFPRDGKKYMRVVRVSERERRLEGFDYSGSDAGRWADSVEHNITFEAQLATPACGPAR